jgi:hypothetical protein
MFIPGRWIPWLALYGGLFYGLSAIPGMAGVAPYAAAAIQLVVYVVWICFLRLVLD